MPRRARAGAASPVWPRWAVVALVSGVLVGCGGGQDREAALPGTTLPGATSPSERPLPDPGPTTPDVNGPVYTTTASTPPPDTNLYKVQVSVEGTETPGVVTSDVGGISCPGTCFSRYPLRAPVTLTARPEVDGQVFNGWGGACSSAQGSTCMLSVDESKDVTARYAPAGP
jgi:hypothetical protein